MIGQHPPTAQIRLENVLSALGNPIRMTITRVLADGGEHNCGAVGLRLGESISKSTLTHHWRVLRDSGVIWQRPAGRENLLSLRRDDLNARFPGLIEAILAGAQEEPLPVAP
ncbi:MAG TPA: helix-turn-helix transcriptional regulator [Amycolatopsis sp.]|jgi:DNA-binding transcriptional ArsR family regulator